MFSLEEEEPGKSIAFKTDRGDVGFQSIRQFKTKILICEAGRDRERYTVQNQYDEYSVTEQKVVYEIPYWGIVGLLDLGFARFLFIVTKRRLVSATADFVVYSPTQVKALPVWRRVVPLSLDEEEHERLTLKQFSDEFTAGDKFYSLDIDLTNGPQSTLGAGLQTLSTNDDVKGYFANINQRFFWNHHLLEPFLSTNTMQFILPLTCGYVGSTVIELDGPPVKFLLVSRISKKRVGTRFWRRGVNEDGHTAMEAETDVTLIKGDKIASFCLLRGSVPLFWKQNLLVDPIKVPLIDLTETLSPESKNAMRKHFDMLMGDYGDAVDIIDMIDRSKRGPTAELSYCYEKAVQELSHPKIKYMKRQPVNTSQATEPFMRDIPSLVQRQGFFLADMNHSKITHVLKRQQGIIRLNGLDCVDETTLAQYYISLHTIAILLKELGVWMPSRSKFDDRSLSKIKDLWTDMGDALSMYYTGTPMRNRYKIRESVMDTFISPVYSVYVDLCRLYLAGFADYKKQDTRDLLNDNLIFSSKPDTPQSKSPVLKPIKASVNDQIYLRRRLQRFESCQPIYLSAFYIIRRFTSPLEIKRTSQFIAAMIWLFLYWCLVHILGYPMKSIARRPKDQIEIHELPELFVKEPHGVDIAIRKWRQGQINITSAKTNDLTKVIEEISDPRPREDPPVSAVEPKEGSLLPPLNTSNRSRSVGDMVKESPLKPLATPRLLSLPPTKSPERKPLEEPKMLLSGLAVEIEEEEEPHLLEFRASSFAGPTFFLG
ncbi:SacI homology domain-containing protein [Gorgonomyces haynaldii]|nr:SacI homology domain-containing protein [Gorgonomyces haynaldii]